MSRFGILLVAAAVAFGSVAPASARTAEPEPEISISELSPERFELVYSGTKFTSRDDIERQLLLSSARLAIAHRKDWFVLLALPGERPDVHPPRPNAGFGAKYGHWQPHWNYYLSEYGWQWWHPEWGGEFWTKDVDPKSVQRFEVHAMIDLGKSAGPLSDAAEFSAESVVRDLTRASNVTGEHEHH